MSGIVIGPDGSPISGRNHGERLWVFVGATPDYDFYYQPATGPTLVSGDGSFDFLLLDGVYVLDIDVRNNAGSTDYEHKGIGWRGPGGQLVASRNEAEPVVIDGTDVEDVSISLPTGYRDLPDLDGWFRAE